MKKFNNKQAFKEMQDCLDSDDELPTTYTEEPELPAYLDDDRFDDIGDLIEFTWLTNSQPIRYPQTKEQEDCNPALVQTAQTHEKEIIPAALPLTTNKDTLSKRGIFEEWNSTLSSNQTAQNKPVNTLQSEHCNQETHEGDVIPTLHPPTNGGRILLRKGILKEQDILCIRSLAAQIMDDSALLWFIDFLANKDLQSDYNSPKSCLVPIQYSHDSACQKFVQTVFETSRVSTKFELVVI